MVTARGGGFKDAWYSMDDGSLYGQRRETWNTGCTLSDGRRSSLYATGEIFCDMRYGPMKRCCSFLEGHLACDARLMWADDNKTSSSISNCTSHLDLLAFLSWLALARARASDAILVVFANVSRKSWEAGT